MHPSACVDDDELELMMLELLLEEELEELEELDELDDEEELDEELEDDELELLELEELELDELPIMFTVPVHTCPKRSTPSSPIWNAKLCGPVLIGAMSAVEMLIVCPGDTLLCSPMRLVPQVVLSFGLFDISLCPVGPLAGAAIHVRVPVLLTWNVTGKSCPGVTFDGALVTTQVPPL